MRPTQVSLTATGVSAPILHDWYQTPPAVTLSLQFSSNASATASVLYTTDALDAAWARPVAYASQATTVITVVGDSGPPGGGGSHGLSVSDMVQVLGTGTLMDGWWPVASVTNQTSYTLTSSGSHTIVANRATMVVTARVFTHGTLAALTARATGNYAFPVTASMLDVTAWSAGVVTLAILQGESK